MFFDLCETAFPAISIVLYKHNFVNLLLIIYFKSTIHTIHLQ